MVSKDELRSLLREQGLVPAGADDDTELAIDSLSLVWFAHLLEERHGVVLDTSVADLDEFTSVNRVHDYLTHEAVLTGVEGRVHDGP